MKQIGEHLAKKDRMNFVVRNCAERMMKILKTLSEDYKQQLSSHSIESLNAFKKIEHSQNSTV